MVVAMTTEKRGNDTEFETLAEAARRLLAGMEKRAVERLLNVRRMYVAANLNENPDGQGHPQVWEDLE